MPSNLELNSYLPARCALRFIIPFSTHFSYHFSCSVKNFPTAWKQESFQRTNLKLWKLFTNNFNFSTLHHLILKLFIFPQLNFSSYFSPSKTFHLFHHKTSFESFWQKEKVFQFFFILCFEKKKPKHKKNENDYE